MIANNPGFDGASLGLALSMAPRTNDCAVLGFDDGPADRPALELSLDFDGAELLEPGLALKREGNVGSAMGKVVGVAVGSGFGADVGFIVGLGLLGGDVDADKVGSFVRSGLGEDVHHNVVKSEMIYLKSIMTVYGYNYGHF